MTTFIFLASILVSLVGAVACAYNVRHARDPWSTFEPQGRARAYIGMGGLLLALLVALGITYAWGGQAELVGFVAILIAVTTIATVNVGRAWDNHKRRQKVQARWDLRFGLLLALLPLFGVGCATYSVTQTTATGSVTLSGASLLTDKGIAHARVQGLGDIDGYSNNASVDAMRALGQGLAEGLKTAAK